MNIFNLLKKILKRLKYILLINPKKRLFRKISSYSIHKNPSFLRISSNPYVSGDTFRNYSDHVFDETTSIKPEKIKRGEIVFLKTDLKEIFFSEFHKKIKVPYILISHNSDQSVGDQDLKYIDEKIIHWFSQNLSTPENDKVSILPIGLENRRYFNNGIIKNFKKVLKNNSDNFKLKKVLCSFNPYTNKNDRMPLIEIAKNIENIDIKNYSNNLVYLNNLSLYQYNLCPEGNGVDTHRIWETLFFNNVPVVKQNIVNSNLSKLGIPLVVIKDWEVLQDDNLLPTLDNFHNNKQSTPSNYVKFEFWKSRIEKYRSTI